MKTIKYSFLSFTALLVACTAEDTLSERCADARELKGVQAVIADGSLVARTRAADKVTPLAETIGRKGFVAGDKLVFTDIRRTTNAFEVFTYPGGGNYEGIVFETGSQGGWTRVKGTGEPDHIYWTDAVNPHTFVAYCVPMNSDFDWTHTQANAGEKANYFGSLGKTTDTDIVYASAEDMEQEDLLLSYSKDVLAEPGGNVALIKFQHALSNVRVVVNINGFSAGKDAVDNKTSVSNMVLLHQPTDYIWMQANAGVHPLNVKANTTITRKNMKLWIPNAVGEGADQNKNFTFYGITTPQPADYLTTLPENDEGRKVELQFDVTYPNPLNPSENLTKTYKASLSDVYFEAGYNTTINITLNHRDEQMVVGAEYKNWEYVATPEEGKLKKNSTFLQSVERKSVTIVGDENATADDATWLYKDKNNTIVDIYGHDGSKESPYQISTADELLSFAYEVNNNGYDFTGKTIRLDADITMQASTTKTNVEIETSNIKPVEWIGIGEEGKPFNGTFLGGDRYINRLKGKPLFINLGNSACVEQLYITTTGTVTNGALAGTNNGVIGACKVIDEVETTSGVLVGTNNGTIYACSHTGAANDAKLVGTNNAQDKTIGCYVASDYSAITSAIVDNMNKDLNGLYEVNTTLTQYEYVYSAGSYPTVKKK